jgi:radical SAM protein with 4Fe4S-binding SPASM domain
MAKKIYYLAENATLKWLESPCIYNTRSDELYEVDEGGFNFLKECAHENGCSKGDTEFIDFCIKEGLLNGQSSGEKGIPVRQSPVPSLRYLELQITDRCNLNCKHCYIGKCECREMPFETLRAVMKEFESMQGLRLLITGGEPLLHSQFERINAILPDYELRKVLFTNGLLLTRDVLKWLSVDEVQVSIDGLETAHDLIRGRGTYGRAMQAIRLALDSGFDVSVSTMIHSGNLDDFEEMEEAFRDMGIRDWTVDVPCLTGNLRENSVLLPPADVAGKYLAYGFGNGLHGGGEGYVCGLHLMSVMPDGNAAKCAFYVDDPVGNIRDGLESCWERIEHMKLEDTECDCSHIDVCRGGCRFRASITGSPVSKDLYRCASLADRQDSE